MKTEAISREPYVFFGDKAADAASFFDTVLSRNCFDDLQALAWKSAHTFRASVKGPGFVSFRHGLIFGNAAETAAESLDREWKKAFDECPQVGRHSAMTQISRKLKKAIEDQFHVRIVVMDEYYY